LVFVIGHNVAEFFWQFSCNPITPTGYDGQPLYQNLAAHAQLRASRDGTIARNGQRSSGRNDPRFSFSTCAPQFVNRSGNVLNPTARPASQWEHIQPGNYQILAEAPNDHVLPVVCMQVAGDDST